MKNKTVKQAEEVLKKDLKGEVQKVEKIDVLEETRQTSLRFFMKNLNRIEEESKLKKIVGQRMETLLNDPEEELTLNQLLTVYTALGDDVNRSTDVLLSLLKTAPNTENQILKKPSAEQLDQDKAFENVSAKDLQNIQVLQNQMNTMANLLAMQNQSLGVSNKDDEREGNNN